MLVIKSKVLHVAVAILVCFVPMAMFVDPNILYLYNGCIMFCGTIAVIHAYWPALKESILTTIEELQRVDALTMAVFLVFSVVGLREGYTQALREFFPLQGGTVRAGEYFLPLALFQYLGAVSALLAVAARQGTIGPDFLSLIPGWPRAILSVFAGFVVATLIYLTR